MYAAFVKLLNMSLTGGIIAAVVILLRAILKGAPKRYICILWAVVAVRLLCPVSISSPISAYGVVGDVTNDRGEIEYFQYNGKSEKPNLIFEVPVLPQDSQTDRGETEATRSADVYLPTLMVVWASGAGLMLSYGVVSYWKLKRETAASIPCKGQVYICEGISSPFILGVFKPRIYLPSGMDEITRKNVLAHERAHLRRYDHLWKPLGFALLSLHWFNPLLWAAYILFCKDIEAACDERVIESLSRDEIARYSKALLDCATHKRTVAVCPVAFGEGNVKGRVRNVLNYRKPAFWTVLITIILCVTVAVCFLTNPKSEKEAESETPSTRVLQAVVSQIENGMMTVRPVEGSWELNSSDTFVVPVEKMQASPEPQVGDTIEIMYGGSIAETYPAQLEKIFFIRVVSQNEESTPTDNSSEPQPLPPYQASQTVWFSPADIHDIDFAEIHEAYGDFKLNDPEALRQIEAQLNGAEEITAPACPFATLIYLYREDGKVGTIEPAEDSCNVFRSDGRYYQFKDRDWDILQAFGVQRYFSRVETTQDGENRIVTIRRFSWYMEDGRPTVAVFDGSGRLVSRENALTKEIYEYDENGYCIGWQEYYFDENGSLGSLPGRSFTYAYDKGQQGLIGTIRDDADGNHDVFEFEGSYEQQIVLQKTAEYIQSLTEQPNELVSNLSRPFVARVSPPDLNAIDMAEGYTVNEYTLTQLCHVVEFQTRPLISVYLDAQGEVIGMTEG